MSRRGPALSYLFFADDLVLLCEVKEDQFLCLIEGLDTFCNSSGQKVNFGKSLMMGSATYHPLKQRS